MDLDERIFQIPIMQRPSRWRRWLAFLMAAAVNVLLFYSLGVVRSEPSLEDVSDGKAIRILAVDLLRDESGFVQVVFCKTHASLSRVRQEYKDLLAECHCRRLHQR